ncbi:membrane protein insertion efficiency factor YidD [Pleionea sediminis]|uniref:membrane protein insertion efficiency factor YidD n=1 Tax=Pleionea sediminis TaxID=2569479 RepID=UPI0011846F96|nr:membrane protein insertion efficiency factor YidD [Pleionea sediminis]
MRKLLILIIRLYQKTLSVLLGQNCRFSPSCSEYAITALERFGILKGSWLSIRRILRCHPLNEGGTDPVPETFHWHSDKQQKNSE